MPTFFLCTNSLLPTMYLQVGIPARHLSQHADAVQIRLRDEQVPILGSSMTGRERGPDMAEASGLLDACLGNGGSTRPYARTRHPHNKHLTKTAP